MASLEKRVLASILDTIFAMLPFMACTVVALSLGINETVVAMSLGLYPEDGISAGALAAVVGMFVGFVWALWYHFTKDGNEQGAGWGKRKLKLMVVDVATNRPASRGQSAGRNLVWMLLNMIPILGFAIEPLFAIFSSDGRRLGDRAAGTQVIEASEFSG